MSILGNILGRIFRRGHDDRPAQKPQAAPAAQAAPKPASQPIPTTVAPAPAAAPAQPVDIEPILDDLADKAGQPLNWRTSIVDLMKLLDLDSSLAERKALADELGYTGDKSDSAAMNVWLHKQVMKRVAENGGRVPANLRD